MSTYDNLNIAQTTLIFQMVGETANPSVSSGIFDLSSLVFLPNVPLIDQIEVERIFDTGEDTKFSPFVFTIANRREMFIFPKDWYTINEQTKVLTFKNLSTIPVKEDGEGGGNGLYYPYSRTYQFAAGPDLIIPVVQATSTQIGTVVRNADIVYIRRKTPSINSIVTFAPGTRLTTTQLNLQFNQLKYIVQELVARIKNEAILKYDENAIDGPFLGQGDLKMNGNSLKDLGSLSITTMGTSVNEANSNLSYSAKDFAASVDKVYEAVTSGTVYRSGLTAAVGSKAFTGDFTASNAKIINVANGSVASDAATFGQIGNASNLITGTLPIARIDDGTFPLEKLSSTWVSYTLPSAALPTILSNNSWGSSTASNTNNMVYLTTDVKGRITAINHRNLHVDDLPTSGVNGVATIYGASGKVPQITVDTKGRITVATDRTLGAGDISSVNASAVSGTLAAGNLPLVSGYSGTTSTTSIPTSITVDTFGRVTAVSSSGLTASNISDFNTAVQTSKLNQMTAPTAAVSLNNQQITNLGAPTLATDAATRGYVTGYAAPLSTFTADVTSVIQPNSVYWDSGNSVFTASRSSTRTKVRGVATPVDSSDAVPLDYFTGNALVSSGGLITAAQSSIINMPMRAVGSIGAQDAVNFGFIESVVLSTFNATNQLVGTIVPQVYRVLVSAAIGTPATVSYNSITYNKYSYTFTDGTNPLYATTSTMVLVDVEGSAVKFVPQTLEPTNSTAFNGYFWLEIVNATTKKIHFYVTTVITPTTLSITYRNFGLSRLVSGAVATTGSQGIVSVDGTNGGITVTGGALSLTTATTTQLGGIKLGTGLSAGTAGLVNVVFPTATNSTLGQVFVPAVATSGLTLDTGTGALSLPTASTTQLGGVKIDTGAGLTNTSGLISVTRSDSTSSNSTTTLANSKAVNDLKGLSMLLDGTQTMTGKLKTFASTASVASLNVPIGSAVTTLTSGDIWNVNGNLQYSPNGTAVKTLAYLDSSITGNAATATALNPGGTITLTGAVTSSATTFTGSAISIATTLASSAAVISLSSSHMTVSNGGTGAVTLTLPQAIGTGNSVQFTSATLGNILISNTANTISTSATNNLILAPATAATTVTGSLAVSTALTVDTTSGLTGAVTLGSTLALSVAGAKIALGNATAASATTSINLGSGPSGTSSTGDLILRVPAGHLAHLVANDTPTFAPADNDLIITKGVMNTAIAAATGGFMTTSGAVRSTTGNQVIGTSDGNFIAQTASTARLTIANNGAATFANALTVSTGGLNIAAGGLTAAGTTSLTGAVTINNTAGQANGLITAAQAPSSGSHLTNKTYVDDAINSISDTNANIVLKKLLMQVPIKQYVIGPKLTGTVITLTTSGMDISVPKYFPIFQSSGSGRSTSLTVSEGQQVIILYQARNLSTTATGLNYTASVLNVDPPVPISIMLAYRPNVDTVTATGTFTRLSLGSILTGAAGGTSYVLSDGSGQVDFILMRIA